MTDPSVQYEKVLILGLNEKGLAGEDLEAIAKNELKMDKIDFIDYKGSSQAALFDHLFFKMCSAPYILSLGDSFETRMGNWYILLG
jgi:hypothetical protein